MVANESEALRWVTMQWERRIETDVILNVYGMLCVWYKSGHEEGISTYKPRRFCSVVRQCTTVPPLKKATDTALMSGACM